MKTHFQQLIPGNPGTSFITALLYAISNKYHLEINNQKQLSIFTEGIVNSRRVFYSGVLNVIASRFNLKIACFTSYKFQKKLAEKELDQKAVSVEVNSLGVKEAERLLTKFGYIVLSVDMYCFRGYHDYHFVCINRSGDEYEVFEPKSGTIKKVSSKDLALMVNSVRDGLNDFSLAFCC